MSFITADNKKINGARFMNLLSDRVLRSAFDMLINTNLPMGYPVHLRASRFSKFPVRNVFSEKFIEFQSAKRRRLYSKVRHFSAL